MVSKRLRKQLKGHMKRSCKYKKKYNKFNGFIRLLILKFKNNGRPALYKCLYGDHYHVGNKKKCTMKYVRYYTKIYNAIKIEKELRQLGVKL